MDEAFELSRFVSAQDADGTYDHALAELRSGRKTTHWMWFVFPQLAGLGRSATAQRYAISSLAEARAYLRHPILGPRLLEVTDAVAASRVPTAEALFGGVDAQKMHSCVTLFGRAAQAGEGGEAVFVRVLDRYFGGRTDPGTDALLV